MARMLPNKLLAGTQSNAERKVFHALKDLLPESYTVFHSIAVYFQSEGGRLRDGEIDFIVAHPERGVLLIEVKGGGIHHDSSSGEWTSTDIAEVRHKIKNPYEQGKGYKYALIRELRDSNLTKRFSFPMAHAVWFPDIDLQPKSLGFSSNLENITLDASALPNAERAVDQLFRITLSASSLRMPGNLGIQALINHLAPNWDIPTTLSARIIGEQNQILEATKSQYKVLSLLRRIPRALIQGCAGSGKTLLALEKARQLADEGQTVLLVCFNKRLASWIQERVSGYRGVHAFHFHGLCTSLCREADMPIPSPDPNSDYKSYYEHDLPESLLDALANIEFRVDALIVDEGQDFNPAWWIPLQECLKDPVCGIFYIFFDDNQAIYRKNVLFPFQGPTFSLIENCRNTKAISKQVSRFYKSETIPYAIGPEGEDPQVIVTNNEHRVIEEIIKHLVHVDHVRPRNIVVLTPCSSEKSFLLEGERIGNIRLSWKETNDSETVLCSTIHSFKGLESDIIIICELSGIYAGSQSEMLYVGMSRGRHHLVVIVRDESFLEPKITIKL